MDEERSFVATDCTFTDTEPCAPSSSTTGSEVEEEEEEVDEERE